MINCFCFLNNLTTTKGNTAINKGKITSQDNSGTVEVGIGTLISTG